MPHWVPCRVPSYLDLLGRSPALWLAIQQAPLLPAHGGLGGTADIITGGTRDDRNSRCHSCRVNEQLGPPENLTRTFVASPLHLNDTGRVSRRPVGLSSASSRHT